MPTLRRTVQLLVPPVLALLYRRICHLIKIAKTPADSLFDGNDALFKRIVPKSSVYGEYGMGASTKWVYRNTTAKIVAVDTSEEWVKNVEGSLGGSDRAALRWVDLGPIKEWGWPTTYVGRKQIPDYTEGIWNYDQKPDVVLVDGRFRVACFLTSLLNGAPGTRIIFDDYNVSPHYHVVEEVLERADNCGRQALFVIPENIDRGRVADLREKFMHVRD